MYIQAFFTDNNIPAVSLNPLPTIRIRDVSTGLLVVEDQLMQEVGDGFYTYNFSTIDASKDYTFRCDGGVSLSDDERYTYGNSGEYSESISNIESKVDTINVRSDLIRKIQTNRLELSDGSSDNWILYDDDDVTVLLTFSVSDKNDGVVVQSQYTPSKRSKAIEA